MHRPLLHRRRARMLAGGAIPAALALALGAGPAFATAGPALASVTGPTVATLASTVSANGDLNPYGVAVVPDSVGALHQGDVLVSNFNDAANLQGTGTTIMQIAPSGQASTFAAIDAAHLPGACPGGVGLTTALAVLRSGWVIVGSLPTSDGTAATAKAGCLLVLDSRGTVRETFTGNGIDGPWDMAAADYGSSADLFVTNVLNGTVAAGGATVDRGTVLRISLRIPVYGGALPQRVRTTVIGSGFPEHTDPAALVVGPTGVSLAPWGTLYVADTAGNRVAAIPDAQGREASAGTGYTVSGGGELNSPLGLTITHRGLILTVNAGDGNLVPVTPGGRQLPTVQLDGMGTPPGAGSLFGLATAPDHGLYFVDDDENALNLLH